MPRPRKNASTATEQIRSRCTPAAKALIRQAVEREGSVTLSDAVLDAALIWAADTLGLDAEQVVAEHGSTR